MFCEQIIQLHRQVRQQLLILIVPCAEGGIQLLQEQVVVLLEISNRVSVELLALRRQTLELALNL